MTKQAGDRVAFTSPDGLLRLGTLLETNVDDTAWLVAADNNGRVYVTNEDFCSASGRFVIVHSELRKIGDL